MVDGDVVNLLLLNNRYQRGSCVSILYCSASVCSVWSWVRK